MIFGLTTFTLIHVVVILGIMTTWPAVANSQALVGHGPVIPLVVPVSTSPLPRPPGRPNQRRQLAGARVASARPHPVRE